MLAASVHLMQGTPYIFQGEEIGMTNPGFTELSQYRDVESLNMYKLMVEEGTTSHDEMMAILQQKSRDNSRTPMQWNSNTNAGFTSGTPWIGIAENYPEINAQTALQDQQSVFYFYKELIRLRKTVPVITDGSYTDMFPEHKQVHGYLRENTDTMLLCLNNYFGKETEVALPESFVALTGQQILSNYGLEGTVTLDKKMVMKPYETVAILINK